MPAQHPKNEAVRTNRYTTKKIKANSRGAVRSVFVSVFICVKFMVFVKVQ